MDSLLDSDGATLGNPCCATKCRQHLGLNQGLNQGILFGLLRVDLDVVLRFSIDVVVPTWSGQPWNELPYILLVGFVLGVFLAGDALGEPSATLEEKQIANGANKGPIQQSVGLEAAPLVQCHPDGLLAGKVRVTGEAE